MQAVNALDYRHQKMDDLNEVLDMKVMYGIQDVFTFAARRLLRRSFGPLMPMAASH